MCGSVKSAFLTVITFVGLILLFINVFARD